MADPSQFVNPFSVLAQPTAPTENKALTDLMRSLGTQKIANKGGLDRQRLADVGAMNRENLKLGLPDTGTPGYDAARETVGKELSFKRILDAAAPARRAGYSLIIPKGGVPTSEMVGLPMERTDFPQTSANKVLNELERTEDKKKKVEKVQVGGVDVGAQKVTESAGGKTRAKGKGTPEANRAVPRILDDATASRMKAYFQAKNPGVEVSEPFEEGGVTRIMIGGVKHDVN